MEKVIRAVIPSRAFAMRLVARLLLTAGVSFAYFSTPLSTFGASIIVNTTADEDNRDGDCPLRYRRLRTRALDAVFTPGPEINAG